MKLFNVELFTGGDGLVAARHLWHYGYKPTVYYPKQSKSEIYEVSLYLLSITWCTDQGSRIEATSLI